MSGKTLRRKIAVLAVLALLAVSWAEAGVRGGFPSHAAAPAVSWSLLLERLWILLTGNLAKNGCSLDPNGVNCPHSQSPENGCTIDPNGACVPATPTADNGCSLDPSGQCSK
jgi:hypothetical protein